MIFLLHIFLLLLNCCGFRPWLFVASFLINYRSGVGSLAALYIHGLREHLLRRFKASLIGVFSREDYVVRLFRLFLLSWGLALLSTLHRERCFCWNERHWLPLTEDGRLWCWVSYTTGSAIDCLLLLTGEGLNKFIRFYKSWRFGFRLYSSLLVILLKYCFYCWIQLVTLSRSRLTGTVTL